MHIALPESEAVRLSSPVPRWRMRSVLEHTLVPFTEDRVHHPSLPVHRRNVTGVRQPRQPYDVQKGVLGADVTPGPAGTAALELLNCC